jgi:hypothetical protein
LSRSSAVGHTLRSPGQGQVAWDLSAANPGWAVHRRTIRRGLSDCSTCLLGAAAAVFHVKPGVPSHEAARIMGCRRLTECPPAHRAKYFVGDVIAVNAVTGASTCSKPSRSTSLPLFPQLTQSSSERISGQEKGEVGEDSSRSSQSPGACSLDVGLQSQAKCTCRS